MVHEIEHNIGHILRREIGHIIRHLMTFGRTRNKA